MGSCCAVSREKSEECEPPSELSEVQSRLHVANTSFTRIFTHHNNNQSHNMASLVHEVTDTKDFEEQLKEAGNKLVVVDFYATWCGPCKIIGPKVEVLAGQFTDVIFLKVDVDECEEIATKYSISCMPTFLYFKSGEKVVDFSGANADKVKELILQHK